MHLVRFLIAVVLIESVVLVGVALERQQLVLRGRLSAQEEQIQQAKQERAKQLLRIGQLSSAPRILGIGDQGSGARERGPGSARPPSSPGP